MPLFSSEFYITIRGAIWLHLQCIFITSNLGSIICEHFNQNRTL